MKEDIELKLLYVSLLIMLLALNTLVFVEAYHSFTITKLLKSCTSNYSEMCPFLLEDNNAGD